MLRKEKSNVFLGLLVCFEFSIAFAINGENCENGVSSPPCRRHPHPLEPLSEAEIRSTCDIIKNAYKADFIFSYIGLKEPPKSVLLPYFLSNSEPPSSTIPRRSFSVVLNRSENRMYEFTVNLDQRRVETSREAPEGSMPLFVDPEEIARKDPTVQERSARLGYPNMSLVVGSTQPIGYIGDIPEFQGKQLCQVYLYGRNFDNDNLNAHPFDFLVVVDMLKEEVIAIQDLPTHDDFDASNKEGNTVPRKSSNFDPELREPSSFRQDLEPVKVTQRKTSFKLTGNEIQWQKFKFRVGINAREGLVLYFMNYNDGGKVRPLFYRMSLAELFVPYGDPRPPYHRKQFLDVGQFGVGITANSLKPNSDCIGKTVFIDAVVHNYNGDPVKIPNAVCIREEDAGILWKHTDYRTGRSSLVRSQRLALTFVATIGNYDYLFTWNFYQDGSIEYNVQLSGSLSTNLMAVNATPAAHGSVVMPQLYAAYHQHFFSLRLDVEIDGNGNRVSVSDVVPGPGGTNSPSNPYGQGFTTEKKVLKTAAESRTNVAPEKSRTWIITNSGTENPNTGGQTGWKLMPYPSAPMLFQDDSPLHPQVAWMDYHTWVTPYKEDQLFPGGYYLNNSGLPEWVGENEGANILDTDVVLWHNFGLSHIPRAEDFPVMPVESCSIFLKPYNFFLENPALDVLPPVGRITV